MRSWILFFCLIYLPLSVNAQTYPAGFSQVLVANGISAPTAMAFAPDARIFVTTQPGILRVIKDGVLLPTPALRLTVNSIGERGLIGITFDPDFKTNNYVYLYYTATTPVLHNRISRFTIIGDTVNRSSEQIVLDLDRATSATNHNGGAIAFGPDGKLYVAVGDHGERDYPQNLDIFFGKVLRINKDGSVPEDNPFASATGRQKKRVWSFGLRNPYTLTFQPDTGRLFINDVGQSTWEEINDASASARNFGWSVTEGFTTDPKYISPVYAYSHGTNTDGRGCAITGGAFFNPRSTNYPSQYWGKYFFQDYCARWINLIDYSTSPAKRSPFAITVARSALYMTTGPDGNLYYLSRTTNSVYKIVYNRTSPPFITNHPDDVTELQYDSVTFTSSAIGSLPLIYQWQKDSVDIEGATSSTYSINTLSLSDSGKYRVIVSNSAGKDTSEIATLHIVHVNTKPVAQITQPAASSTYVAGTALTFSGTGTDVDDGELGSEAFSWEVNFHQDTLVIEQPPLNEVTSGTIDVPNFGVYSTNVWYRFILTVTDSEGAEDKDSVDVLPAISTISLATDPPGFQITFDGDSIPLPFSVESIEGMLRSVEVPSPQIVNDVPYEFTSWSNGGEANQTFATPHEDITLTAHFSVIVGIEDDQEDSNVMLFANPVRGDKINLGIKADRDQRYATIKITDARAYQVLAASRILHSGENNIAIDAANLKTGLYFVSVEITSGRVVKKVLVLK